MASNNYHWIFSFNLASPIYGEGTETFNDLLQDFSAGSVLPSTLLITTKPGSKGNWDTVMSSEAFKENYGAVRELNVGTGKANGGSDMMEKSTFYSLFYNCDIPIEFEPGKECFIPYGIVAPMLNGTSDLCILDADICTGMQQLRDMTVNATEQAIQVQILQPPGIDPFSRRGGQWIKEMRQRMDALPRSHFKRYLANGDVDGYDGVNEVIGIFPFLILGLLLIVSLFVSLAFGSVLIPVRSVLSLGVTFASSFGLAILTYQKGVFGFTGVVFLSNTGSFYWIAPVIAGTVLIGIGLDYDIFLLTRISEYREEGFTVRILFCYRSCLVFSLLFLFSFLFFTNLAFFHSSPILSFLHPFIVFLCFLPFFSPSLPCPDRVFVPSSLCLLSCHHKLFFFF